MSESVSSVRVGIGGWNFPPWRGEFYPSGLPQALELGYASAHLTAIEVNSTYYSSQKPATFAKWRRSTPPGFVFALKGSRYATQGRRLADSGASVKRFVDSGIAALGDKLGPIVWQLPPTKAFDEADLDAFLAALPAEVDGLPLRHVLEVRHPSFEVPAYLALARRHRVATVFTDAADRFPSFADATASLVYARLMAARADEPTGYAPAVLDAWARRAVAWADGEAPDDLPRLETKGARTQQPQDVFVFFINGAKERAPAAALGLLARLRRAGRAR